MLPRVPSSPLAAAQARVPARCLPVTMIAAAAHVGLTCIPALCWVPAHLLLLTSLMLRATQLSASNRALLVPPSALAFGRLLCCVCLQVFDMCKPIAEEHAMRETGKPKIKTALRDGVR